MGLIKITFDDSTVSSKQDADINYHLGNLVPAGIIKGLGDECSAYISNNKIYFRSGYVQIYGRRIFVEAQTYVSITTDSTRYGYVIITVNLSTNTAIMTTIESTSSSISLTQQDLSKTGTIYQMPLIKYQKTTSSVSFDTSFTPTYIESAMPVAQQALTKANSIGLKTVSSWQYAFDYASYEWKSKVTFNIANIPEEAIILIKFENGDVEGYGGFSSTPGCLVFTKSDLTWNENKTQIRNGNDSGWITITIKGSDFGQTIDITWSTNTNMYSIVYLYGYYVG